MKKYFLILMMMVVLPFVPKLSANQLPPRPIVACADQLPYGWPQLTRQGTTPVCRTAYALLHDDVAKVSPWVVYTLLPQHAIGCVPRSNAFAADQSLPVGQRSELVDYDHSGYDQGHIANDGDMSWDVNVEHESFILSNMSPQLPSLNRGIWKLLETGVRVWSWQTGHAMTVYAGSIYDVRTDSTIGPDKVDVPHAFYKIVIDDVTHESRAWIFPHKDGLGTDLTVYQVTVTDVERATGIVFPVPDAKNAKYPMMPIAIAEFNKAKSAQCH
jgi:endonuclease G